MMESMNVFLGRQPIFDRQGSIYGYELLYRNSDENTFPNVNPEKATLHVFMHTFLSFGIHKVVGNHKVFINFSEDLLKEELFLSFPPKTIVIEVLETVMITPNVLKHIKKFKEAGYQIALDDFKMREDYFEHKDIFSLVDIIKVDLLQTTSTEQIEIFALRQAYPQIKLLAEKVETKQQREISEKLSYDLFQGYFYAVPEILSGYDIAINPQIYQCLQNVLQGKEVDYEAAASYMMRDVSLLYKFIRYSHTVNGEQAYTCQSIQGMMEQLGAIELRKWLHMVDGMDSRIGEHAGNRKALEERALLRGEMCRLLALQLQLVNEDEFFLLGSLSLIDVMLKQTMDELLQHVSFSSILKESLAGKETRMSPLLKIAIQLEKLQIDEAYKIAEELGIRKEQLSACSQQAHRWLNEYSAQS